MSAAANLPTRDEIAAIVLEHWPTEYRDPRYPSSVQCGASGCEWTGRFPGDISEHVADLITGRSEGGNGMRAWAAPIVDGKRLDASEIELATDGSTVLPHTLPWPAVAYRYEFAPGEEIPTRPLMVRSSTTEEELTQDKSPLRRAWDWLLGGPW